MNKLLCVGISIFCLTFSSSNVLAAIRYQCDPPPPNTAFCGANFKQGTITCSYKKEGQPFTCETYGHSFRGITPENLKVNNKWQIGPEIAACGAMNHYVPLEECWWEK